MLTKVKGSVWDSADNGLAVSVKDFGAVGDGSDETTKIQAAIDANEGKTILFDGAFTVTSLTVNGDNTHLKFTNNSSLSYATETNKLITLAGNKNKVSGLTVNAPSIFDGTNAEATYSVIWVTGDDAVIENCFFNNVPRVGIMFYDCVRGAVQNCTINGNYPSASFTGTETCHAGIVINPPNIDNEGVFRVTDNFINSCVQGVLGAAYGTTSENIGLLISGNIFEKCWNHGTYIANKFHGIVISGNNYNECQYPIAATGEYHSITGNVLQTQTTGNDWDLTGISLRDPVGCIVQGNTVYGDGGISQVSIGLIQSLTTTIKDNIISGNVIKINGGSVKGIAVGTLTTTECSNNIISNNVLECEVGSGAGMILVTAGAGTATNNKIHNNNLTQKSRSYGVQVINGVNCTIGNNTITLEYDAAIAETLAGVVLSSCEDCYVHDNKIKVDAAWGANVSYRGVWELTTATNNRSSNNIMSFDLTKLTSGTPFVTINGGGIVINDSGLGAPNLNASPGSVWRRTDGGPLTSFYVKESGTDTTGWVGK